MEFDDVDENVYMLIHNDQVSKYNQNCHKNYIRHINRLNDDKQREQIEDDSVSILSQMSHRVKGWLFREGEQQNRN